MWTERVLRWVDKPARAAILASLISAGGGLPAASAASVVSFGKKVEFVGTEEFISTHETVAEVVVHVAKILKEKDLNSIRSMLSGRTLDWRFYGTRPRNSPLTLENMMKFFESSFSFNTPSPSCVGYTPIGSELHILFNDLDAFRATNSNGHSFVVLTQDSRQNWGISYVEQLRGTDYFGDRGVLNIKACPSAAAPQTLPKLEAKPAPVKAEVPKDLPKGRIVYQSDEKDGMDDIYTANADGSDKKPLVSNPGHDRYATRLDNDNILYSEWKDGKANIVVVDVGSGEKRDVTTLQDKPANTIDICPSPDSENDVIFTRSSMTQNGIVNQIMRGFLDGRKPEVLKPGLKEDFCPIVSPDRKYVATTLVDPVRGFSEPQGVAIYEYQGYGKEQAKLIARLAGIRLLGWLPTGKEVFLTKKGPNGENLYIVSIDGKQSRLITDMHVRGASASADGKWILVSASRTGESSDLWLFPSQGGQGTRITNTPYSETEPQWLTESKPEPKPEPEPEVEPLPQTFIALIPGMLTPIERGWEVGGRFSSLRKRVVSETDLNIGFSRIFISGMLGGYFDNRGFFYPYDQNCENTLQSIELSAENQANMILKWVKIHPKDKLIIVAHSLGGPVMLRGLEMVRDIDPDIDLSKVVLITTDSPNQGIDKPIISSIGQILPQGLPEGCYMDFGDFRSPPPQIFSYPVMRELLAMWDRYPQRREELVDLMTWYRVQGGRAIAAGNYQDCVIAWEPCGETFPGNWLWDAVLPPFLRFIVKDPYFWLLPEVLYTQMIPGANKNIMQALGKTPNWGHTPYLIDGQGMDMLIGWIREEVRRRRRLLKAA